MGKRRGRKNKGKGKNKRGDRKDAVEPPAAVKGEDYVTMVTDSGNFKME
jgi:hypothetical protein